MKKLITIALMFIAFLAASTGYAEDSRDKSGKILIVLTSHDDLGGTGKKTGFWLPELTHPYYEFIEAGYTVDVASIDGGTAPLDGKAFLEEDEYHQLFLNDAQLMAKVLLTIPLSEVDPSDYRAIMFAGGSGPMWDFPNSKDVSRVSSAIYENQGIVSAVCHGNAALVNLRLSNGALLVEGRRIAAFTNEEEAALGTTEIVPFLLQDKLIERGAIHIHGEAWKENVVVDGRLVTGQNPGLGKESCTADYRDASRKLISCLGPFWARPKSVSRGGGGGARGMSAGGNHLPPAWRFHWNGHRRSKTGINGLCREPNNTQAKVCRPQMLSCPALLGSFDRLV